MSDEPAITFHTALCSYMLEVILELNTGECVGKRLEVQVVLKKEFAEN